MSKVFISVSKCFLLVFVLVKMFLYFLIFTLQPHETRDEVEINSESMLTMGHLASKMESYGGIALVIDYGHCGTKSDTFRVFII